MQLQTGPYWVILPERQRHGGEWVGHERVRQDNAESSLVHKVWVVVADAFGHLIDDDGMAIASHVALSLLMTIFPFIIFVAALAGFVGELDLAEQVANIIFNICP